ncbi:MAG: hypothetical protein Q9159_005882 [Coniocarpon cinnabarinum]
MTAQILSVDLATIISETKKKAPDIRVAAEQSLQDLKALPSTSEAQLAADLRRRPHFINPFIAACKGRQPKAIGPAVSGLQRLIVGAGLPPERLKEVLQAFQDCTSSGLDVQLKILQALPSLLQGYAEVLEDELQFIIVHICTALQQVKNSAVSSTASATLQQTISSLYDKVEAEDEVADDIAPIEGIAIGGESIPVRSAAYDAYRILQDMCLIIEGQQPQFLTKASIAPAFGLELIEALLLNHAGVFSDHLEQSDLLLNRVMPLVNSCLAERYSFTVTVRAMRLLCILMREHLGVIHTECEVSFGLLNHIIETENLQQWRRALCMEVFRLLYSNSDLFIEIYSRYDLDANKRNVIQDNQALFVRLASERPALIGLGQSSTVPASKDPDSSKDQAVLGAEAAAGMIGGDFGVGERNVPGISMEWSSMKVPCMDQLDKPDAPTVPETYIYSLVLTCVNQLSDLLARVVLPVVMHSNRSRRTRSPSQRENGENNSEPQQSPPITQHPKRQSSIRSNRSRSIPTNPLDMEGHPAHGAIKVVASVIDHCWPAILATASTFFNAALDTDFYRGLVRGFQKFTQVAGILRLSTPRDALLTSIAKFAVPSSLLSNESVVSSPTLGVTATGVNSRSRGFPFPMAEAFTSSESGTSARSRRSSLDATLPTLTQRNLMCLRALVHLAIALGPILAEAWSIVLDSIQKAHVVLSASQTVATAQDYKVAHSQADASGALLTLGSEISAVESAITRLFQSTADYPADAFRSLLTALCSLVQADGRTETQTPIKSLQNLAAPTKSSRRVPSVSGLSSNAIIQPEYSHFAVLKIGETAAANLRRLSECPEDGWDMIIATLTQVTSSRDLEDRTRKASADVVTRLAAEICITNANSSEETRQGIQQRAFDALQRQIRALPQSSKDVFDTSDADIQQMVLDALHSTLDHCGDSIITGWNLIFEIAGSAFIINSDRIKSSVAVSEEGSMSDLSSRPLSAKLARSSFASLQLVCSDFMSSLSYHNVLTLVDLLTRFGQQTLDMNISLTVVTHFWNISDYLRKQIPKIQLEADKPTQKSDTLHKDQQAMSHVWMTLQQRLAQMSTDERADMRNSAIYTVYRTFHGSKEQLSDQALSTYLHTVLFEMMKIDSRRYANINNDENRQNAIKGYIKTSQIVLEGYERVFEECLSTVQDLADFEDVWQSQLEVLAVYLSTDSFAISRDVYAALKQILAADLPRRKISDTAAAKVASIWARSIPRGPEVDQEDSADQEKSFVAYIRCIQEIHRQLGGGMQSSQVDLILERLYDCVSTCAIGRYNNDIDQVTELQNEVLKTYTILLSGSSDHVSNILDQLSRIIRLPYDALASSSGSKGPTFVALAKRAMNLLPEAVAEHLSTIVRSDKDALSVLMQALIESVRRQYTWQRQGKAPFLWQAATWSSLSMLRSVMTAANSQEPKIQSNQFYRCVIDLVGAVQAADCEDGPPDIAVVPDETFDLDAVTELRSLLTPILDSMNDLDDERMRYIQILNEASTLHASPFDSSSESLSALLGKGPKLLSDVRPGRTYDPDFDPRVRMCYSCFDELFDIATSANLTAAHPDGKQVVDRQQALLAPISHQTLLIRSSIPLKRYIADQPLRGRTRAF